MKLKSFTTLVLLFILSFSVLHEIEFAVQDKDSCNITEYVKEFDKPINNGDICDIHSEYHQPYILPQYDLFSQVSIGSLFTIPKDVAYYFKNYLKSIKPPIT